MSKKLLQALQIIKNFFITRKHPNVRVTINIDITITIMILLHIFVLAK